MTTPAVLEPPGVDRRRFGPVDDYDGASPFPDQRVPEDAAAAAIRVRVTLALVLVPFAGLVLAGLAWWSRGLDVTGLAIGAAFYVFTGLGVTVGFHRGLTHRSYRASQPVRLILGIAGSMAFQGNVIDWVAAHRRHHAFTDRPGDPHSPYHHGTSLRGQLRGLGHAHLGWFLKHDPTPPEQYAPDLLRDPMMRGLAAAFPFLSVVSLVLPAAIGWSITGTWTGALAAFIWGGLARVCLLQHVTWSINSLCHVIGRRPYATRRFDRSTDVWPLALLSFGESWHNGHHADPSCARHGRGPRQLDISAIVIRLLERAGWAHEVKWPTGRPALAG